MPRDIDQGLDEFGFALPAVPKVTADTPGAVWQPTYTENRGNSKTETGGYYRLPTPQERGQATLAALPQDVKNKIAAGLLTPTFQSVRTREGRGGEGYEENGDLVGFTSPGANNTYYTYDLSGNVTGQQQNPSGGGGFLGGILDKIGSGVSDFISDPSRATTNFFENPGVKEAAIIAAIAHGVDPTIFGGTAGAGAAGAGTLGAAEGALTAAEIASLPGAATGAGAGLLAGGGGDAALAALDAGYGGAGELLSAAPEILTAGSAPGALSSTLPSYLAAPEILTTAALPTATEIISAGTTPGGTLPTALGNEAVASGTFTPGSVGSVANAAGVLTPTQTLAAAGLPGLSALTGADAAAAKLAASANEAVASGLSQGSVGAAQAAAGMLTPAQLAAASGTLAPGSFSPLDLAKGVNAAKSLMESFNTGAKLGVPDSETGASGAKINSDLARIGKMGSGDMLQRSVQQLYNGSPANFAQGGHNVIPELMSLIQSRARPDDHTHPNYDGVPLLRTGGLSGLGGKYVEGKGDGTSDDIAAMLANGEYVFSADVVAALGNGSNKAGAEELDKMVRAIRSRARSAPPDKLPPDAKSPLEYMKSSKGKKYG